MSRTIKIKVRDMQNGSTWGWGKDFFFVRVKQLPHSSKYQMKIFDFCLQILFNLKVN